MGVWGHHERAEDPVSIAVMNQSEANADKLSNWYLFDYMRNKYGRNINFSRHEELGWFI